VSSEPTPGTPVRLAEATAGMAAGATGLFIGWYANDEEPEAVVNFWDGGPLRVPADLVAVDE
jgi:hypothetical protein